MSVIVTDNGFQADDLSAIFVTLGDAANDVAALDVPSETSPKALEEFCSTASVIRVDFPSFADGRGFTIARQLRRMGFTGRLRARGHIISDQYAMARRCGFDEVEISKDLADRQLEQDWIFRAKWQKHDYQARLRG